MREKLHILIYGHEFPNSVEPVRGTFIERILAFYTEDIEIKVVAPVPWFLKWRKQKSGTSLPLWDVKRIGNRIVDIYRPRFILFPMNVLRPCIGWFQFALTYRTVATIHKAWKIDLVHVNFSYPDGVAARHICNRLELGYVITEHRGAIGSMLDNLLLKNQICNVYRGAKKVIAVSEFTKSQILDRYKYPMEIEVIPNGIQTERFQLTPKKPIPHNLVYIGNLIYNKGIHILLKSMATLRQEKLNFTLTLIGEGKYKSTLQYLTHELDLDRSVTFLGAKSPDDVTQLLPRFDILVLPSFIESFSIVLIEAMAAGLPVVASSCGGPESLVTEETGILIEPYSVDELTTALKTISTNWQKFDPSISRNYAIKRFDIVPLAHRICAIYRNIV